MHLLCGKDFLLDSIIGLLAAVWVIFVLIITKKVHNMPHQMTAVLAFTQVSLSLQRDKKVGGQNKGQDGKYPHCSFLSISI